MDIQKRFPSDPTMDELTFLNDKKVDAQLYALFQEMSYAEDKKTVVYKKSVPSKKDMCKRLGYKSVKTFNSHLDYLIAQGYIIEEKEKYILPEKENIFLLIPLETLHYLNDVFKEQVIKIYLYLLQRFKYKPNYIFTSAELATHIGLSVNGTDRTYQTIINVLTTLVNDGFLEYEEFYEGSKPKKRLKNVLLKGKNV